MTAARQRRTRTRRRQSTGPDDVLSIALRAVVGLVVAWFAWRARRAERKEERNQ